MKAFCEELYKTHCLKRSIVLDFINFSALGNGIALITCKYIVQFLHMSLS